MLLAIRDMGKSVFATIGDVHGRIQIYLNHRCRGGWVDSHDEI